MIPPFFAPEMEALEVEIDDEWSDLVEDEDRSPADQVEITLSYPHLNVQGHYRAQRQNA
ncbi:MAG: hypothetical protein U0670_15150 [Anaerolineae bacterium]